MDSEFRIQDTDGQGGAGHESFASIGFVTAVEISRRGRASATLKSWCRARAQCFCPEEGSRTWRGVAWRVGAMRGHMCYVLRCRAGPGGAGAPRRLCLDVTMA